MKKLIGILIVTAMTNVAWADDVLTPTDKTALTEHLNVLAVGWHQPSVDAANNILTKTQYTATAWDNYFTDYFITANAMFTDDLANYLQYPVLNWFGHIDGVHENLQEGLAQSLMQNVNTGWAAAIAGGGNFFENNLSLKQDVFNSQKMLSRASAGTGWIDAKLSDATKATIYNDFKTLINANPTVLKKSVTFNRTSQPYFGTLRAQAFMALFSAAESADSSRADFTPAVKTDIADTLGLATGDYADIWNDHTLLLLDNNGASTAQKNNVKTLLTQIPGQMHNTATVTIKEFLDNSTNYLFGRPYDGVNVFGIDVGVCSENPFPDDVSPCSTDLFTAVLAHELNHVVDVVSVKEVPAMAARRQALLDAAGDEVDLNYLRSMHGAAFFHAYPQEFIASISNQWFADSSKTIELGLVRFDNGYLDPVNQALFFAEIYSLGGDSTLFYEINASGEITRYGVPLGRDANGFIDELTFDGKQYLFDLDFDGNVNSYTIVPLPSTLLLLGLGGLGLLRRKRKA